MVELSSCSLLNYGFQTNLRKYHHDLKSVKALLLVSLSAIAAQTLRAQPLSGEHYCSCTTGAQRAHTEKLAQLTQGRVFPAPGCVQLR